MVATKKTVITHSFPLPSLPGCLYHPSIDLPRFPALKNEDMRPCCIPLESRFHAFRLLLLALILRFCVVVMSAEEVHGRHQQQASACYEERQVHARLQDRPQDS